MAWILFIDESGHDHSESPYEVLAGLAVEDSRVWSLVTAVRDAELAAFGVRLSGPTHEPKGRELLKRKTFRLASQMPPMAPDERTALARSCLEKGRTGGNVTRAELTALGQAKVAFVERTLELCASHQARAFASIVDRDAPRPTGTFLRKDCAYLFERFFYLLDDQPPVQQGLVVFDERDKTQSHILIAQMEEYFLQTAVGRMRAARVVPEPLFVHSDLTTLVRLADFVAYLVVWGAKIGPQMTRPRRDELGALVARVLDLRYRAIRDRAGEPFQVWSFAVITDLRPRSEKP